MFTLRRNELAEQFFKIEKNDLPSCQQENDYITENIFYKIRIKRLRKDIPSISSKIKAAYDNTSVTK